MSSCPFRHGLVSMPSFFDINQYRHFGIGIRMAFTGLRGILTMSEITKSEAISRRRALSFFGKVASFAVAVSTTSLKVSDAEAQTAGMVRRQERRAGRHERREEQRTGTTTSTGTGTLSART